MSEWSISARPFLRHGWAEILYWYSALLPPHGTQSKMHLKALNPNPDVSNLITQVENHRNNNFNGIKTLQLEHVWISVCWLNLMYCIFSSVVEKKDFILPGRNQILVSYLQQVHKIPSTNILYETLPKLKVGFISRFISWPLSTSEEFLLCNLQLAIDLAFVNTKRLKGELEIFSC